MKRRFDIDWLRVIAIILVLYFHVAMIFTAEWGWHIKNAETSYLWLEFNFWLSRFRMPLLFFISGYGTFLALRRRSNWQYLKERHNRLMIPLVLSMFVIVPPQIYFERISDSPGLYQSFIDFYPQTFNFVPYPAGDFSWHHMWFVLYLFFYSAVGLPLFLLLKRPNVKAQLHRFLGQNGILGVFLLVIPTLVVYLTITIGNGRTNDFINDWAFHPYWFSFFFAGYIVGCAPCLWDQIISHRRTFLGLAFGMIVLINYFRWNRLEDGMDSPLQLYSYSALFAMNTWMWILMALGYAGRYLNRPSPVLAYMNQAIYPFYILHQTVIITIGYYVIQVEEGVFAKYIFVSTLSLIFTLLIYEFLVRPFRITRFLFGVKETKPHTNEVRTQTSETVTA